MSSSSVFTFILLVHCLCLYDVTGSNTDSHEVTVQLLSEGHRSRYRTRRDVDNTIMPDALTSTLHFQDSSLILRLRKSKLLTVATGDVQKSLQANILPQDSAVYTDPRYESTFIVHRLNGTYNLTGTFSMSGASWSLEPVPVAMNSSRSQPHRAIPYSGRQHSLNFGNDAVTSSEESPELIHTPKYSHLSKQRGQRLRRAITRHVVEIAYIVDYVDYRKWATMYGETNALIKLRLWYTYVADSLRAIFEGITDPDISISTTTTVLKVLTTEVEDVFLANITTNGQIGTDLGLKALSSWAQQQPNIPLSDHYVLFIGRDITPAERVGVAYLGRTCTADGVSMVENLFKADVAQIAAHELGHSLNASHDGETNGTCSDSDQFVMETSLSDKVESVNQGNPWRFSKCSIQKFKSYLSSKSCTRPEYTALPNTLLASSMGQRAGETVDRNEQCRLALNYSLSEYNPSVQQYYGGESLLCSGMLCKNALGTFYYVIPLEYTPCGANLSCVLGYCVPAPTPATTTSTAQYTNSSTTATPTTTKTKSNTTSTATPITSTTTTASTPTTTKSTTTMTSTPTTTKSANATTATPTTSAATTTSTSTTTKSTTTITSTPTTTKSTTISTAAPTTSTATTTSTSTTTKSTTTMTSTPATTKSANATTVTPTTSTARATSTPTTTKSTTITTSNATKTTMKPMTEGDCYLNESNGSGTSLIDCLMSVWQQ